MPTRARTLVPSAGQTAALVAYYEARGVPEPYLTYLKSAAAGTEPFVFLKADGTALSLIDAAKYDADGTDNPMAVPDDFPLGTYTVSGTVEDEAGNTTVVTFKLIVSGDRVAPEIAVTGVTDTVAGPLAGTVADGFTLPTTNVPSIDHELSLAAGSVTSEALADAYTGLYLVPEAGQTAALESYYADKSRVIADSYSETYLSDELDVTMWDPTGQTFTAGAGGTLDSCQFLLRRVGAVTGDVYAKLWAHSGDFGVDGLPTGTALATSAAVEVSTISESWALVTFTFDNTLTLEAGTPYVITVEYPTGVDGTLYVGLDWDGTILHAGTGIYTDGTGWNVGTADVPFYVYVSQPNPYLTYLKAAAAGAEPFAYLKADGTTLSLVDAAKRDLGGVDVDMTVPDDFPLGTYTVTGTVADAAGNTTAVTFKLVVSAATP